MWSAGTLFGLGESALGVLVEAKATGDMNKQAGLVVRGFVSFWLNFFYEAVADNPAKEFAGIVGGSGYGDTLMTRVAMGDFVDL